MIHTDYRRTRSLFPHYMNVGENDFHILKRDQSILVDFETFPLKLIELIRLCLLNNSSAERISNEDNSNSNSNGPEPDKSKSNANKLVAFDNSAVTFIAKLDTSGENGVFSVVEANRFKQLTHISLVMKPGDDAAIKHYLASRLALTLEICRSQSAQIKSLNDKIRSQTSQNEKIIQELSS